MTIFNKLSGLAQRAKDNAIAKTFLAKDIRLELSLSDGVDIANMAVSKTGYPILVIIDRKNVITTIDLKTKQARHKYQMQGIITSVEYCTGTDWLYVGLAEGSVDIFDLHLGTLAKLSIPNLLIHTRNDRSETDDRLDNVVVALQMHPTNLDFILIGYNSGFFLWDIREQTVKRAFTLRKLDASNPLRNSQLTCLTWNPRGDRIIGGYDDGYMHFWDANNDQMPIFSRQALQSHLPPSENPDLCEPVYRLAWYVDTTIQKSFLLVAGGSSIPEIQGIHVLEFDLDSESRDARKQSIIHTPVDVADFVFICREPYFLGMHNPLGVLVVGCDDVLRAYSFEYGYPLLTLPPALDFLEPPVANVCQAFMLPESTFRKLCAVPSGQGATKYLPLTGGIAGNAHIYKIPSNDILMTIHSDEMIRFWDAAYTSLRPLPYLTIQSRDNMDDSNAQVTCVDLNSATGSVAVGCTNGMILIYEFVTIPEEASQKQDDFIDQCDDTLKEISALLKDMEAPLEEQPEDTDEPKHLNKEEEAPSHSDNLSPDNVTPKNIPANTSSPNLRIIPLDSTVNKTGYVLKRKVILQHASINQIVSHGENIIVFSASDGSVIAVDTDQCRAILSLNIKEFENKQNEDSEHNKHTHKTGSIHAKAPVVSCLQVADSYSVAKHRCSLPVIVPAFDNTVIDIHVINLEGRTPSAEHAETPIHNPPYENNVALMADNKSIKSAKSAKSINEEKPVASGNEPSEKNAPFSLLRKPSRKSSKSHQKAENKDQIPDVPKLPGGASVERIKHTRHEYIYQQDPHFLVLVSLTAISIYLSGFNIKIYSVDIQEGDKHDEDIIIRSRVVRISGKHILRIHPDYNCSTASACVLVVILQSGRISLFSLPGLKRLNMLQLDSYMLQRLPEVMLSQDGRLTLWTEKYELEQRTFMPQNQIPFGEDITLHSGEIQIPPHPSTLTQRPKKSWLDTVSGAFKKDAFTVNDLNVLMGRVPPVQRQASKAGAESSKPKQQQQQQQQQRSGVFKELSDKMNERGERLNQLDQKFEDMNAASSDFLRSVREYNERQARKKWWEF
ncbi:hypothetical protein DFQ28_002521 [Apophysomyces sp. BC1034]|nr:hypothetical protein DFQ29_001848 [Apophysomyces sp. BC1021]KAG0190079.1 hypothetical protein DFQ28_002521 [Apophysomyces sp. BC1034]